MPPLQINGLVTQRSNGTIEITSDAGNGGAADKIVIHESALGSKRLPQMGDKVALTLAFEITATAAEIEAAHARDVAAKKPGGALAVPEPVHANAPATEAVTSTRRKP